VIPHCRNILCDSSLVTPMKNGGNGRHATSGGIQSGSTAFSVLGRTARRVVLQFSPAGISNERIKFYYVISVGPPVRHRGGGHHHLSSPARPIRKAEDRAAEPAVPLEGAARLLDPHARGDGKPQVVRSLVADMPDYFLRTIWASRLLAKVQATLACWTPRPTMQTASPTLFPTRALEHWPTDRQ
jgi:hypothetical protein